MSGEVGCQVPMPQQAAPVNEGGKGTAADKITALRAANIAVSSSPAEMAETLVAAANAANVELI